MAETCHTWEHDTVQSLAVLRLRIVQTSATLLNSHLYTEGYIIVLNLGIPVPIFHLSLSRKVCSKMLSAFIDSCIRLPTLQAIFDHMKPKIDP